MMPAIIPGFFAAVPGVPALPAESMASERGYDSALSYWRAGILVSDNVIKYSLIDAFIEVYFQLIH